MAMLDSRDRDGGVAHYSAIMKLLMDFVEKTKCGTQLSVCSARYLPGPACSCSRIGKSASQSVFSFQNQQSLSVEWLKLSASLVITTSTTPGKAIWASFIFNWDKGHVIKRASWSQ